MSWYKPRTGVVIPSPDNLSNTVPITGIYLSNPIIPYWQKRIIEGDLIPVNPSPEPFQINNAFVSLEKKLANIRAKWIEARQNPTTKLVVGGDSLGVRAGPGTRPTAWTVSAALTSNNTINITTTNNSKNVTVNSLTAGVVLGVGQTINATGIASNDTIQSLTYNASGVVTALTVGTNASASGTVTATITAGLQVWSSSIKDSFVGFLNYLLGSPINLYNNLSTSGLTTAQMLQRLDSQYAPNNPAVVIWMPGTNDNPGTPNADGLDSFTNVKRFMERLNAKYGTVFIVLPMPPRNGLNANEINHRSSYNKYLIDWAETTNYVLVGDNREYIGNDLTATWLDNLLENTSYGGNTGDGTHPITNLANYLMALPLANALKSIIPPMALQHGPVDTWDGNGSGAAGTFSDGQNILSQRQSFYSVSSGGTYFGSTVTQTGNIPADWAITASDSNGSNVGSTIYLEMVPRNDVYGAYDLQFIINATAGGVVEIEFWARPGRTTDGKEYVLSGCFTPVSRCDLIGNAYAGIRYAVAPYYYVRGHESANTLKTPYPVGLEGQGFALQSPPFLQCTGWSATGYMQPNFVFQILPGATVKFKLGLIAMREYSSDASV